MLFAQVNRLRACGAGSAEGQIQQQPTSRNWSSEVLTARAPPVDFRPQCAMSASGGSEATLPFAQSRATRTVPCSSSPVQPAAGPRVYAAFRIGGLSKRHFRQVGALGPRCSRQVRLPASTLSGWVRNRNRRPASGPRGPTARAAPPSTADAPRARRRTASTGPVTSEIGTASASDGRASGQPAATETRRDTSHPAVSATARSSLHPLT